MITFQDIQYGFQFGAATITRLLSDAEKGWVVVGVETKKTKLQVYVTKSGKVRVHDEQGREWLPMVADCYEDELPIPVCKWLLDHSTGSYDTGCGQKFLLDEGTPAENNFRFCPFCGSPIEAAGAGEEER